MDLLLVRHGESESNSGVSDSKDSRLTPLGHRQARWAAAALRTAPIEGLYCSPQVRALETAAPLAAALGVQAQVWVRLCEQGFSATEPGLPRSVVQRRFPRMVLPPEVDEAGWSRHWHDESREQLDGRMREVAAEISAWAQTGRYAQVACVIHGASGSSLLRRLLGVAPGTYVHFYHDNCGITRVRFEDDGRVTLRSLNETSHLADPDVA